MDPSAEPTKEELAKAVYELSIMVGLLPSRIEKDCIMEVTLKLVCDWWEANREGREDFSDWLKTPGHVRDASKKGYQLHYGSKQ
jgi:hypothetical protein